MVRDEPGVVYHALGVNGASTKSFLRSENFIEQAAYLAPDLVIFGLGINDAYKLDSEWRPEEYKMRYDTLVQWFRSVNPECEFIFMTNNDSYYKRRVPNEHALDVVREMKRLSREHNTGFWDLFGVMGGLNSLALWEENGLAKSDKVHFTRKGYTLNSDLLFWAFWEDYEKHLKKLAD
jgi:lysophospholipase L1-like esterase